MKLQRFYLIASLLVILTSAGICLSQDSTTIQVLKNGKLVSITNYLREEGGKKVLVLDENKALRTFTEEGVRLVSSHPNSVAVLTSSILVGVTPNTESEIKAFRGDKPLTISGLVSITAKVRDDSDQRIVAQSTFLPFKTVKDNYGKKFAQSYFVVQVDIRNEKEDQQFIVQKIDVMFDQNQCDSGLELNRGFLSSSCREIFEKYLKFPRAQQGIRRDEVIGVGKADLNRSNRNVGFRILTFSAAMGTILTGFDGVLGPDGVKGMSVLGTTVSAAANELFPNSADEKLENLRNALPTEDVIIKSKESRTFNIFIPTERIFWTESWTKYIQPPRDSEEDTLKFRAVLDLVLLSSATGVLVDNDAPPVTATSADRADEQVERFSLDDVPSEDWVAKTEADATMRRLADDLFSADEKKKNNAKEVLKRILETLGANPAFQPTGIDTSTFTSDNAKGEMYWELRKVIREARNARNQERINDINETIIRVTGEAEKKQKEAEKLPKKD